MTDQEKNKGEVFGFNRCKQFLIGANRTNQELVQRRLVDMELADMKNNPDIIKYAIIGVVIFMLVVGSIIVLMKFTGENTLASDNMRLNRELIICENKLNNQGTGGGSPSIVQPKQNNQING